MNIVLGEEHALSLSDRYTVLRLDTFFVQGQSDPIKSYCVIEYMPSEELEQTVQWSVLHEKLMENYAKQNWVFCEQAIEHLMGKWNRELDSFYLNLLIRIRERQGQGYDEGWSPIITR